jgi:ribonuclease-3
LLKIINKIVKIFKKEHRPDNSIHALEKRLDELQRVIKYKFKNLEFLKSALTHESFTHDYSNPKWERAEDAESSYERMEFLGDAVLGLVVAEHLFRRFPHEDEGFLSKLKSNIVSEKYLALKAGIFHFGNYIIMSEKEEKNGGRERKSIVSDVMEALICAIYLDGGFYRAKEFITSFIIKGFEKQVLVNELVNYKSILQEYSQSKYQNTPQYKLISEAGPDHSKIFKMEVYINSVKYGAGEGPNKKDAQQHAAQNACKKLKLN